MKTFFSTYLCCANAALSRYLKDAGRDDAAGGHIRKLMDDAARREFLESELYVRPVEEAAAIMADEFYP